MFHEREPAWVNTIERDGDYFYSAEFMAFIVNFQLPHTCSHTHTHTCTHTYANTHIYKYPHHIPMQKSIINFKFLTKYLIVEKLEAARYECISLYSQHFRSYSRKVESSASLGYRA